MDLIIKFSCMDMSSTLNLVHFCNVLFLRCSCTMSTVTSVCVLVNSKLSVFSGACLVLLLCCLDLLPVSLLGLRMV